MSATSIRRRVTTAGCSVACAIVASVAVPIAHGAGKIARTSSQSATVELPSKKSGSGVSIRYQIAGSISAGQSFTVTMTFSGVTHPQGGTAWVSAAAPMQMTGQNHVTLVQGLEANLTLDVIANADGVYFLHVFTRQGTAGGADSIMIKVGDGKLTQKNQGQMKTTVNGERVVSLPSK